MTTTVPAAEVRAAADLVRAGDRAAGASHAVRSRSCRPSTTSADRPPRLQPGDRRRQPARPAAGLRRDGAGWSREATLGLAYEGPPGFVHGGMSSLLMDQLLGAAADGGRRVGHDRAPGAGLPRPAAAGRRRCSSGRGVAESAGRKTRDHRHHRRAADAPDRSSSRPAASSSCRGRRRSRPTSAPITDASGRHRTARAAPGDATALGPGLSACPCRRRRWPPRRGRAAAADVLLALRARRAVRAPRSGTPATPPPSRRSSPS